MICENPWQRICACPHNPRDPPRRRSYLALPTDSARERLIESGLGGSVVLIRKLALLVLDFKLEEFFFERIEKGGRAPACCRRERNSRSTHRPHSACDERNPQPEERDHAIRKPCSLPHSSLLHWVGSLNWLAQTAARAIIGGGGTRSCTGLVGRVLRLVLQHSFAGNFEGEFLSRLRIAGDFS